MAAGELIEIDIEKPAGGGRMIGRLGGQVVLVAGAIPGERVSARIEKVARGVAYAMVVDVGVPSPDRRRPTFDPMCGGCLYAHIAYPRQLELKSVVIADAFERLGHLTLPAPIDVAASKPDGYRMRARLHARGGRFGFFREGTHDICDAAATGQLLPQTAACLDRLEAGLRSLAAEGVYEIDVTENLDASERAVHLSVRGTAPAGLAALGGTEGLTGLSVSTGSSPGVTVLGGTPYVVDRLAWSSRLLVLRRHVRAFFQGNRYLLARLLEHVTACVPERSRVVDLYAGGGAFALTAAVLREAQVTAVEGDPIAAADLSVNAARAGGDVRVVSSPVEHFTDRTPQHPDVVIVDPPRTGMSREALGAVVRLGAPRVVYVSCDAATLARDARRLVDAGYAIARADAFDLFPNTPHVETVLLFNVSAS
jgi:23S rRNA (uracil1939-C5)-methyltransferase